MEIRIGSFNMNNFGGSSNKDFGKIAEIIVEENLDVVALQEIFSEGRGVSRLLEQNVKYELYNWDYCFAAPSESRDITKMEDMVVKKTRSEGYAFLWKKSRFKKVEFSKLGETRRFEPRIINSLSKDVCVDCSFFARAPYYIRLQPIHGGFFELRLVNVHIFFGDTKLSSIEKRQAEYAVLTQQIYPEICQNTYGQNRTPYDGVVDLRLRVGIQWIDARHDLGLIADGGTDFCNILRCMVGLHRIHPALTLCLPQHLHVDEDAVNACIRRDFRNRRIICDIHEFQHLMYLKPSRRY